MLGFCFANTSFQLDKSDWKALRLVHSDIATTIAPLLFDTISFDFRRNGDQGFNDVYTASATNRLLNLVNKRDQSAVRNISHFPRRFRFTVKSEASAQGSNRSFSGFLQGTTGMAAFMSAFETLYPRLLHVFSNIRDVDVHVSAACLRKHHARTVFNTVCRASNVDGRALSVTLTGV